MKAMKAIASYAATAFAAAKALGQLFIDADVIEYRAVRSPDLSCSA